jgi:PAS domain-containing protein
MLQSPRVTALIRIDRSWAPVGQGRPRPIRFCSRCGQPAEDPPGHPELRKRVCGQCGMGMILSCPRDAFPGEAAAFLILDYELRVAAVSQAAERFFGKEKGLIGTGLLELLTSPLGDDQLARNTTVATQRPSDPQVMPVRLVQPSDTAGRVGTMAARIATCGPPRAALLTVEPSEFGRR